MGRNEKEDRKRTLIIIVLVLILTGFIVINVAFRAGIIYTILLSLSLIILLNWGKIEALSK